MLLAVTRSKHFLRLDLYPNKIGFAEFNTSNYLLFQRRMKDLAGLSREELLARLGFDREIEVDSSVCFSPVRQAEFRYGVKIEQPVLTSNRKSIPNKPKDAKGEAYHLK